MTYTTYPYAVKANGVYYSANTPVPVPDAAVETAAPAAEKAAKKSANTRKGRKAKSAD